jgi:hypothetical protein
MVFTSSTTESMGNWLPATDPRHSSLGPFAWDEDRVVAGMVVCVVVACVSDQCYFTVR